MTTRIASLSLIPQVSAALNGEADLRTANSLAVIRGLVRLRAANRKVADPHVLLMEIADRIDTVAMLTHSDSRAVQLRKYLQEICEHLNGALAPGATSFSVTCSPAHIVPFEVALPLGIITAELFSNSLKYAHPTGLPVKIMLSCTRAEPVGLTVAYEDDGIGFPEEFDPADDGHLGMRFIRLLSEQLNGTHKWLSDPLGMRFEIVVPMLRPGSQKIPG